MRANALLRRLDRMFRGADQAVVAACAALTLSGCHDAGKSPDLEHAPSSLSGRFLAPRGWTWSTFKLKGGATLPYGVASPPVAPRASVLILPDRSEPGEVWFETANNLLDRGYTVWLLEVDTKDGQALDPVQGALATMTRNIIRPNAKAPLVVVGQGLGSAVALAGLSTGAQEPIKAMLLASPSISPARGLAASVAEWVSRADLGWLPLPSDGLPALDNRSEDGLDPRRARLADAWRRSDRALRPSRPSFGWVWAYNRLAKAASTANIPDRTPLRLVMSATASDAAAVRDCARINGCRLWATPTSAPHLAPDATRKAWLEQIDALVEAKP